MIGGTAAGIIGAALLLTLDAYTPTVKWAAFCVLVGGGIGMAINLPYTAVHAVQFVLEEEDDSNFGGTAVSQFTFQLGAAISLSIGQTIFLNRLTSEVARKTSETSPATIVSAGAYGLSQLGLSAEGLRQVKEAYASAVNHTLIFALAAMAAAFIFTIGMEQRNAKTTAKRRNEEVQVVAV